MNAEAWSEANRTHLLAEFASVRELIAGGPGSTAHRDARAAADELERQLAETPSSLMRLGSVFGLSTFERDVVTLAAGTELDPKLRSIVEAQSAGGPTLAFAMGLPNAHWSALTPLAALRRFRLIDLDSGSTFGQTRIRIDERILHFLLGVPAFEARLIGLVEPIPTAGHHATVPSHAEPIVRIARMWSRRRAIETLPIVQLCGPDPAGKLPVVTGACEEVGLALHAMRAIDLPNVASEREAFARLWEREAILASSVLLIDIDDTDPPEVARNVAAIAERASAILVIAAREPIRLRRRLALRLDIPRPTAGEQCSVWQDVLGAVAAEGGDKLLGVVSQFSMSAPSIRAAAAEVLERIVDGTGEPVEKLVWETCRIQARPKLDDLAQRIEAIATWSDIVLADEQLEFLRDIVAHVRQRAKVYESWGFATRGARGLGITALFAGVSGTGKTMAAEVVAGDLGLDLYRIDLSQVVSKYIGETEKNLRRIFDSAEEGGAVLLFDEADALFGKRSEIKDSHDRYANLEISYLLQRMEQYRGLAILTTNMRNALDTAFLRRLRFVIEFPFPGTEQRAEIWRRVFPTATPTDALDVRRLARLHIPGGAIRNIALNAAFLAADDTEPVRMRHIAQAARIEFAKLERPLSEAELGGWS